MPSCSSLASISAAIDFEIKIRSVLLYTRRHRSKNEYLMFNFNSNFTKVTNYTIKLVWNREVAISCYKSICKHVYNQLPAATNIHVTQIANNLQHYLHHHLLLILQFTTTKNDILIRRGAQIMYKFTYEYAYRLIYVLLLASAGYLLTYS